jgi:hypothetical protein
MSTEEVLNTPARRRRMPRALAGVGLVAVVGAGIGAYLGIHVVQGAGAGAAVGQPAARTNAVMADDPATGTIVMFGGQGKSANLNDTWIWDGSSWSPAHPSTSPPALSGAQMAYDPITRDLVLVGGHLETGAISNGPIACSSGSSGSASGHSGSSTGVIAPSDAQPAATPQPSGKPSTPVVVVPSCPVPDIENTATWLWNGSDWSKSAASTPSIGFGDATLATDPVSGRVTLLAAERFAVPDAPVVQPDIACPIPVPISPNGKPVIAEPNCPVFLPPAQSDWTWNGHAWIAHTLPAKDDLPLGAIGSPIVDDPVSGKLAVFVSMPIAIPVDCTADAPCVPGAAMGDACCSGTVSTWNGTTWQQTATFKRGPDLSGGVVVADPAAHDDVAFTADRQTWLWTGHWEQEHPANTPTTVSGAAAAFDATTSEVVLFGGFGTADHEQGLFDQTWTWDGSNWSMRAGTDGPSVKINVPQPGIEPPSRTCPALPTAPAGKPQPLIACAGGGTGNTGSGSRGEPGSVPGSSGIPTSGNDNVTGSGGVVAS